MVPVRALFCHQCSISVTLFHASPPSLCVFESISGKPARFCPNGYKIPSSRLKSWQRLLGWSSFWAVDMDKQINQSCWGYVISSPGNLLGGRKCEETKACWSALIIMKQQTGTILNSQTSFQILFSVVKRTVMFLFSRLPGQWLWCLEVYPPAVFHGYNTYVWLQPVASVVMLIQKQTWHTAVVYDVARWTSHGHKPT